MFYACHAETRHKFFQNLGHWSDGFDHLNIIHILYGVFQSFCIGKEEVGLRNTILISVVSSTKTL